jgi:uncharacterized membrane protein
VTEEKQKEQRQSSVWGSNAAVVDKNTRIKSGVFFILHIYVFYVLYHICIIMWDPTVKKLACKSALIYT